MLFSALYLIISFFSGTNFLGETDYNFFWNVSNTIQFELSFFVYHTICGKPPDKHISVCDYLTVKNSHPIGRQMHINIGEGHRY